MFELPIPPLPFPSVAPRCGRPVDVGLAEPLPCVETLEHAGPCAWHSDTLRVRSRFELTALERVRIAITGRLEVLTATRSENRIGYATTLEAEVVDRPFVVPVIRRALDRLHVRDLLVRWLRASADRVDPDRFDIASPPSGGA